MEDWLDGHWTTWKKRHTDGQSQMLGGPSLHLILRAKEHWQTDDRQTCVHLTAQGITQKMTSNHTKPSEMTNLWQSETTSSFALMC